jgi:hypothetical protein
MAHSLPSGVINKTGRRFVQITTTVYGRLQLSAFPTMLEPVMQGLMDIQVTLYNSSQTQLNIYNRYFTEFSYQF